MQLHPEALGIGLVLAGAGIGGTLLALILLGLAATVLKRICPVEQPEPGSPEAKS